MDWSLLKLPLISLQLTAYIQVSIIYTFIHLHSLVSKGHVLWLRCYNNRIFKPSLKQVIIFFLYFMICILECIWTCIYCDYHIVVNQTENYPNRSWYFGYLIFSLFLGNGLFYSMSPKYSTVLHSFLNEELFFIYGVLSDWQKMHVPPSTINQLLDFRNLPSDVLK